MHPPFSFVALRTLLVVTLLHVTRLVSAPAESQGGPNFLQARGFHAVPLQFKDYKFRIETKLNGTKCTTVVDTGSTFTLIDSSRIKKSRLLDPDRDRYVDPLFRDVLLRIPGYHTNFFILETLDFPGIQVLNTPAHPANTEFRKSEGLLSMQRMSRTLGFSSLILGSDFLTRHRAIISCLNPPSLLLQATTAATNTESLHRQLIAWGYQTVAMEYKLSCWVVPVEIEGITVNLLLDTGAPATLVDPALTEGLKLQSGKAFGEVVGLNGRKSAADRHALQSFKVGGIEYPKVRVFASDLKDWGLGKGRHGNAIGLLGMDFLSEGRAIIDCGNHRLYMLPPARVDKGR